MRHACSGLVLAGCMVVGSAAVLAHGEESAPMGDGGRPVVSTYVRCYVVSPSTDDGGRMVGADYRHGGQWVRDGRTVGWSSAEDSVVWSQQGCGR